MNYFQNLITINDSNISDPVTKEELLNWAKTTKNSFEGGIIVFEGAIIRV